jgi:hypothetical protein
MLLPTGDQPSDGVVVGDGGAGRRERQAAAGTLAAARDGPGGGRATALAKRWQQARQSLAAAVAELLAPDATDGASKR